MSRIKVKIDGIPENFKIPRPRPFEEGPFNPNPAGNPMFYKGNQHAKAENLSEKANLRRIRNLARTWGMHSMKAGKKKQGVKVPDVEKKRELAKRKRIRLQFTVAKEARDIQDKARRSADAIMDRMIDIAQNSIIETNAIAAAREVLDRGYGKSNQTNINTVIDANGKPTEVTATELAERVKKALERVEALTRGAAKAAKGEERPSDVRQHDRDTGSTTKH